MEEDLENYLCGRCYKKTCVLISDSTLCEFEICKTCYLKLRVQSGILTVEGSVPRPRGRHKGKKGFFFQSGDFRIFTAGPFTKDIKPPV